LNYFACHRSDRRQRIDLRVAPLQAALKLTRMVLTGAALINQSPLDQAAPEAEIAQQDRRRARRGRVLMVAAMAQVAGRRNRLDV
jgi:hypothetical protein